MPEKEGRGTSGGGDGSGGGGTELKTLGHENYVKPRTFCF